MGRVRTRAYRDGHLKAEGFLLAEVSEHLVDQETILWIDFCGATEEHLEALPDELGLHELAVEDALEPHQRPKVDRYATHLFLSPRGGADRDKGNLEVAEIDAFVSERWLVTVRKEDWFSIDGVLQRWIGRRTSRSTA